MQGYPRVGKTYDLQTVDGIVVRWDGKTMYFLWRGDLAPIQDHPGVAGVNRQVALAEFWQTAGEGYGDWRIGRENNWIESYNVTALCVKQGLAQGAGAAIGGAGDLEGPHLRCCRWCWR